MATENQIAANRANAQHSTGPRTDEGKEASSRNATRHSLTSKHLIIVQGQEEAFAELESGLRSKLLPEGPLEEVIFKRAVESAWNLERCRKSEFDLMRVLVKPGIDPLCSNTRDERIYRIHRYARESENSMYKAMRELGKLQAERKFREEIYPLTAAPVSQVCFLSQVMKNLKALPKQEAKASHAKLEPINNVQPAAKDDSRIKAVSPPERTLTAAAA